MLEQRTTQTAQSRDWLNVATANERTTLNMRLTSLQSCADDYSESEPPDPFPNSEVKPLCADGSVAFAM